MSRMWRLDQFVFGDDVPGDEVYVDGDGLELVDKSEALAVAAERGATLFAEWPPSGDPEPLACIVGKVSTPLRWEQTPPVAQELDEALWFSGACGERDYLVGNSHTFTGRLSAWCPTTEVSYSVSSSEITEMSLEARYFIKGFLHGAEPDPPMDAEGDTDDDDLEAWRQAVARFRRNGTWYGRWGTCSVCGSVVLPDRGGDRCEVHGHDTGGEQA
ncbi:hypothetical protein KSP35_10800 [Aquihabitans sp. G128]|uniref:hypothetical protein n=1 Tax=Aquihabitans sp. G128 TaxID=2849779 RepID=UPI001C2327C9|nr:hypothetical protein [Aquihabitans sp. G128]QXC63225.1 hypothetical protein KSP35_10800 [Aquihabitans sp. G128]